MEALLFGLIFFPQTAAGVLAKSRGYSFWFWFFISFLIPIISLFILLRMEDKSEDKGTSYQLADHVRNRDQQLADKQD
ncbi:hypothetical protein [Pedobacter sp. L105]|uniref:hypothetical protein n=1 Tax=Pedobacter sp. L105 TaxID=1641871 RepID=UPI00131DAB45|nr:hypothetical protein [Pedobacter sp. L105]